MFIDADISRYLLFLLASRVYRICLGVKYENSLKSLCSIRNRKFTGASPIAKFACEMFDEIVIVHLVAIKVTTMSRHAINFLLQLD